MATEKAEPTTSRPNDRFSLASVTPNNLGTVRKLNSVLFPIKYSEKFYSDILLPEAEEFCKLVYLNDIPVGTICCRLEAKGSETVLYLMTMGILAPYRNRSLGSQSLQQVLKAATKPTKPQISRIYLHVQVNNVDAKRFYEKYGFEEKAMVKDYYKKISPKDAWMLERAIHS